MRSSSHWLLGLAWAIASGAAAAEDTRFRLAADARLAPQALMQLNSRFALQAHFEALPRVAHSELQTNARFALTTTASASSLVCYNDTIFRDGFDGSGL